MGTVFVTQLPPWRRMLSDIPPALFGLRRSACMRCIGIFIYCIILLWASDVHLRETPSVVVEVGASIATILLASFGGVRACLNPST